MHALRMRWPYSLVGRIGLNPPRAQPWPPIPPCGATSHFNSNSQLELPRSGPPSKHAAQTPTSTRTPNLNCHGSAPHSTMRRKLPLQLNTQHSLFNILIRPGGSAPHPNIRRVGANAPYHARTACALTSRRPRQGRWNPPRGNPHDDPYPEKKIAVV